MTLPEWVADVQASRNPTTTGALALARLLVHDDEAPPVLREISRLALLPRASAPVEPAKARTTDPETSQDAAAKARPYLSPQGPAHRILRRLARVDGWVRADRVGLTATELTNGTGEHGKAGESDVAFPLPIAPIPGAWRRVSDLARDGFVREVEDTFLGQSLKRDGARVWCITDEGLNQLARLDEISRSRE